SGIAAAGARGHDEHRGVVCSAEHQGACVHSRKLERPPHALDARISQDGGFGNHAGAKRADYTIRPVELIAWLWDLVVHLDVHLGEFVKQHGVWVYGLLFVIVFCETGLVVTPFLPGDSLLIVAGTLAALGEMDLAAGGRQLLTATRFG